MASLRNPDRNASATPPSSVTRVLALASMESGSPDAPDYKSPTWQAQAAAWERCRDVKGGTDTLRKKASQYLPKFESERPVDFTARAERTFTSDHYARTLDDLVGLPFSRPVQFNERVPEKVRALFSDIDGKGTSMPVFLRDAHRQQLDTGFVVLMADFPSVADGVRLTLRQVKERSLRPFAARYGADDVLSFREVWIGGERLITQVAVRECATIDSGIYGTVEEERYRIMRQAVTYEEDVESGDQIPSGVGAMTWELWRPVRKEEAKGRNKGVKFVQIAQGTIEGPKRLPVRIAYGGPRIGTFHSAPFLDGLAWVMLEEFQVQSDYANIMHKCNVPTPCFVNRSKDPTKRAGQPQEKVVMGQGIDLGIGGDAFMLEPTGVAINATRDRINDLKTEAKRHGALSNDNDTALTATEIAIITRQRNARLAVAVESLNEAADGLIADLAAFTGEKIPDAQQGDTEAGKGGGTVQISTEFAGSTFDVMFVAECRNAWLAGALPLDAYLHVLATGKLPDDFDPNAVAVLMAAAALARQKAEEQAAAAAAGGGNPDDGAPPPAGKKTPTDGAPPAPDPKGKTGARSPASRAESRAAKRSQGT